MSAEDVIAARKAEAAARAAEDAAPKLSEAQAEIREQIAKLERVEATTGRSGAIPRGPKQRVLAISEATKQKNRDRRLRWVNVGNAEKAMGRQAEGYVRLEENEGGRQVGNLALFGLGKEEYERRVRDTERQTQERVSAHNREMEGMAEQLAKTLRDNHGISVDASRLLIKE